MRKLSNKKIIILSIVGTLVSLSIAFTYAIWSRSFTQTGINTNDYSCFDIKYSENTSGLTLSKKYPIIDEEGLNQESYDVTIQNVCNIGASYTVLLNKKSTSTLADEHVKVAVNGNINFLSDYQTTTTNISNYSDARVIYTDFLSANETKTIKIQSWMDENTSKEDGSNKSFTYKITIDAQTSKNLLADKVLENKVITSVPDFLVGEPPSNGTNTGSGLYRTSDDDGKSYYFRGNESSVQNNVTFAGRKWKIVRINGDSTIRMILVDTIGTSAFNAHTDANNEKYVGYTYDNASACTKENPCISNYNSQSSTFSNNKVLTNSTVKVFLEKWYITNLKGFNDKIALGTFCNDTAVTNEDSTYYYYGYNSRTSNDNYSPSLLCNDTYLNYGGNYKLKIGMLSADEMIFAGMGKNYETSASNYLLNKEFVSLTPLYSYKSTANAPFSGNMEISRFYGVYASGIEVSSTSATFANIRPVINLKSDVQITGGDGTSSNPYVVK